jgi:hypothetical protein
MYFKHDQGLQVFEHGANLRRIDRACCDNHRSKLPLGAPQTMGRWNNRGRDVMPERDARATPVTRIGNEQGPEWVREMQAYYSSNGTYRVEDVQRVLGDQKTVVGVAANRSLFGATLTGKNRRD